MTESDDNIVPVLKDLTAKPKGESEDIKPSPGSGFDIVNFIRLLQRRYYFHKLFLKYTGTISEKRRIYWFILIICFIPELFTKIITMILQLVTLTIIIFAFAKIVEFDTFLLSFFAE